eukprot:UN30055
MMKHAADLKYKMTNEPDLKPYDNSGIKYDYSRLDLPKDKEGYTESFDWDKPEDYIPFFKKYGVVVIHNVLTTNECKKSEDEVWDFIIRYCNRGTKNSSVKTTPVKRDVPETWSRWVGLSKLGILGNEMLLSNQLCENRQNPKIYNVFKNILEEEKLMCVVGRASAMRPTKNVKMSDGTVKDMPEWKTIENWLHWDMNMWTGWTTTFGWKSVDHSINVGYDKTKVQAWVSLTNCGPNDGGFHCIPGMRNHIR